MHISSNIKYLRERQGLKQSELAKQLGKTSVTISDYEKGKSTPPLEVIAQISEIFGVYIGDLVGKDLRRADLLGDSSTQTTVEADYLARYAALQKQQQFQEHLIELQQQRVRELEREIREHAPELAKRLGL